MASETYSYTTKEGDRLDIIAARFYGDAYAGEKTLSEILDKNQDLSLQDPILPVGLTVALPAPPSEPKDAGGVNLWE